MKVWAVYKWYRGGKGIRYDIEDAYRENLDLLCICKTKEAVEKFVKENDYENDNICCDEVDYFD